MSKKSHFRGCFDKQYDKRAQTLLKSPSQQLDSIPWSLARKLSLKKSLFLTCQILPLLFITSGADEKYPVLIRDNLTIPIQMQLSKKQKTFSEFFVELSKSKLNFKHFEKKMTVIHFVFLEVTDSENVVR